MKAYVVDTNVAVVASGRSVQAGLGCISACIDALEEIVNNGVLIVDDGGRILREYMDHLSLSGQPGPGDAFLKWVWSVQATERVIKTEITPQGLDDDDFSEFPSDPALETFDRSDRKYVAVALSSKQNPEVLNAVDSDWWILREALKKHGIRLVFLCPEQFSED